MPKYVCKWAGTKPDEYEFDDFFVEADPDPPSKWKCVYAFIHKDEATEYHTYLPKQNRSPIKSYIRRDEVLNRDLTCTAVDASCELLSLERIEEEPLLPWLTQLAMNIERSRAILAGREPRKFISVSS